MRISYVSSVFPTEPEIMFRIEIKVQEEDGRINVSTGSLSASVDSHVLDEETHTFETFRWE